MSGKTALEALHECFASDVRRWVRSFGARSADVEDLVQDVFVIALRRYEAFRGDSPKAWLYQIARRKVRGYRRLSWIRHVVMVETLAPFEAERPDLETPARRAEMHEQARLVERIIAKLNADQRVAFVLSDLEGRSGEEIALLQKVPLNTVWGRVHRVRQALRAAARRLEKSRAGRRR